MYYYPKERNTAAKATATQLAYTLSLTLESSEAQL